MPKSTKTTAQKRTQVNKLPVPSKEMTRKEKQKVRGGSTNDLGPDNVQKKNISR